MDCSFHTGCLVGFFQLLVGFGPGCQVDIGLGRHKLNFVLAGSGPGGLALVALTLDQVGFGLSGIGPDWHWT